MPRGAQGREQAGKAAECERLRYGVTVFGLMSPGEPFEYATPDTLVSAEDVLVVGGDATLLERFANRR